jgi:hypothetical protein
VARFTRPVTKLLRKVTAPLRDGVRKRLLVGRIQRSVRLQDEDRTERRRRWHVLVDLIHAHCPRQDVVVAEIGAREAVTSGHILKYCPQVRAIHAIDIQDARHDRFRGLEKLHFIQGDSAGAAARFPDESFDLVFIDADHTEQGVRRDLAAWLPKVKRAGVISGHDYTGDRHPGVRRAVDAVFARHRHKVEIEADKVWWTIR